MAKAVGAGSIVDALPVPALHVVDGRTCHANAATAALLEPGEDDPLDRIARADRAALVEACHALRRSGRGDQLDVRAAGVPPVRFFRATIGPYLDGGALVVLQDITETRQVDAALAELATGAFTTDARLRGRWIPRRVAMALGLDPARFGGMDLHEVIHPDDREATTDLVDRATANPGVKHAGSMRIVHPDQPGVWWPIVAWMTWLPEDEALGGLLVRIDAGLAADVHQPDQDARPGTVTLGDASPMGFLNLTLDGRLVQRSTRVREILRPVGVRDDCTDWLERVHPAQRADVLALLAAARDGHLSDAREVCFTGRGARRWARLDVIPYRDDRGDVVGSFVNFLDITPEREARDALAAAREELWQLANHDALTGLYNRAPFTERLERALSRAGGLELSEGIGLLVCDLDGFKEVNDEHGHRMGDEVLVAAARRLEGAVRVGDTICRFGGDEFLVLCEGLVEEAELLAVAERVVAAFRRPVAVDGHTMDVGCSVGGSIALPDDTRDPDALLRRADRALYAAKDAGRRQAIIR